MNELIEVIQHGKVVEVALNRPKHLMINLEMISELATVLDEAGCGQLCERYSPYGRGRLFVPEEILNGLSFSDSPFFILQVGFTITYSCS